MLYHKEYTLVYGHYGVSIYDSNGLVKIFASENEAIEYIREMD